MRVLTVIRNICLSLSLLLLSSACGTQTPQEHLKAAQASVSDGEVRSAVIDLKNAIQKDPDLGQARALLGQLYFQSGDLPSALKELERAIDLNVSDDLTRIALLRTKNALGRYSEVVGELEEQADLPIDFALVLGEAYLIAGDLDRAEPLFQRGLHLPLGLMGMARMSQADDDFEQAYAYVVTLNEMLPDQLDATTLRGEIELQQGSPNLALASFQKVRQISGGEIIGRLGEIRAYLQAGDLESAKRESDALIVLNEELVPAQYLKGLVSFELKDFEAAEQALLIVQRYVRDHGPTLYLMGAVKAELGRLSQAEDNLRRYLAFDEDNVSVRKVLSKIYMEQGKTQAAHDVLKDIALQGEDPQVWAMLGSYQMQLGNMSEAARSFEAAVALAPNMAPFRNQLAISLLSVGQDDQAIAQLSSAIDLDGSQFQSDYILAMVNMRNGDFESAKVAIERFIAKSPEGPIGYGMQGSIALAEYYRVAQDNERGDPAKLDEARKAFTKALKLDPGYFPATANLADMALAEGDIEAAKALLESARTTGGAGEPATLGLVDLLLRQGDRNKAEEVLQTAVTLYPESVPVRIRVLRLALAQNQLPQAQAAASRLYQLAPRLPEALLLKAEVALRSGDTNEAAMVASELHGAVKGTSSRAGLLASVGELQSRIGDLDRARINLERAVEIAPQATNARLSLARLELREGQLAAAQLQIDALRELGVDSEALNVLQANVFIAANDDQAALKQLDSLIADGSRLGLSRYISYAVQRGAYEDARARAEDWLEGNANDQGPIMMLANALINAQQLSQSRAEYEKLLPSNNAAVLNNLAWIYTQQGDPEAVAMARQANEAEQNNPDIQDTLGWASIMNNQNEEGITYLQASLQQRPDNPTVQYHLGVALERTGDRDAARRAFKKALRLGEFSDQEAAAAALEGLSQ